MKLKKYISFFRLRCVTGLQYRAAALAGISTQFAWGFLIIFAYHAFYRSNPTAFPMTLQATVNYTWIQQAFLAMFASWVLDGDILEEITSGSISYSLCRPVDLYAMWYTKSLSGRISRVALRAVPILVVAALLPAGYNLTAPTDLPTFFLFLLTMVLGALNSTAFTLLIYVLTMYTLSSTGLRSLLVTLADFLCGGVVPLPFFPPALRRICELTPFAAHKQRAVPRVQRRYCRHERRFRRRLTNLLAARPGAWRSHPHEKCAEAGSDSGRISGTTSRSAARQIVRVLQYTKKGVIYETIL